MSDEPNEHDDFDLPLEEEIALNGAAAESSEYDANVQSLPRLLRYAILSIRDNSFARERLVAEITEIAPNLPIAAAWAKDRSAHFGIPLALELDCSAVVNDQPELRGIADCVRLLCLPLPEPDASQKDYRRVTKSLLHACNKLPAEFDDELAAEIETFCVGWGLLPAATDLLSRYPDPFASSHVLGIGRRFGRRRIHALTAKLNQEFEEERREWHEEHDAPSADGGADSQSPADEAHCLVVCRLDEIAMKNQKLREVVAPLKPVINVGLPLVPVPPLHEVRAKLLFEFPYAEQVIDFALADLVGRTTARLRPIIFCGPSGGGKSRFARRLGQHLNLHVWRTDASRSDGATFGGTDKRWHSAEPCHPFLAIAQAKQASVLILIDEIEKAGTRTDYGRFWDCLLGLLEPESAARYPDPALQTNLNLSEISYVATANSLEALPSPLRDRFRVITFPKPTARHLDALLPAVMSDLAAERGLDDRWVYPLAGFERDAVAAHWRGGSVRRLRRVVEIVLRARERAAVRN